MNVATMAVQADVSSDTMSVVEWDDWQALKRYHGDEGTPDLKVSFVLEDDTTPPSGPPTSTNGAAPAADDESPELRDAVVRSLAKASCSEADRATIGAPCHDVSSPGHVGDGERGIPCGHGTPRRAAPSPTEFMASACASTPGQASSDAMAPASGQHAVDLASLMSGTVTSVAMVAHGRGAAKQTMPLSASRQQAAAGPAADAASAGVVHNARQSLAVLASAANSAQVAGSSTAARVAATLARGQAVEAIGGSAVVRTGGTAAAEAVQVPREASSGVAAEKKEEGGSGQTGGHHVDSGDTRPEPPRRGGERAAVTGDPSKVTGVASRCSVPSASCHRLWIVCCACPAWSLGRLATS
jgi:hypothetical protein